MRDLLRVVAAFLLIFCLSAAARAETWKWSGGGLSGTADVKKFNSVTMAAIDQIAVQLGYTTKIEKEELLVRGGVGMRFVHGAAVVWLGYDVISLPARTRTDGGHWWVESNMAMKLFSQFLKRNGRNVTLSWAGSAAPAKNAPAQKIESQPKTEAKNAAISAVAAPATLPSLSGLRWGGEGGTIRAVLDLKSGPEAQYTASDGTLAVSVARIDAGLLPKLKSNRKDIALSVENGDPALLTFSYSGQANCFTLQNPHRFVIDFKPEAKAKPAPVPQVEKSGAKQPQSAEKAAKPRAKGKKLVVIDAGHGGKDPGAMANGYQEKVIALQIAKRLEKSLTAKGVSVKMTRTGDTYPTLKERTAMANNWNADVFVSIHLNALPKGRHSSGIEVYLMALPTDNDAMTLAKIENAEIAENGTASAGASDRQTEMLLSILGNMQQNAKIGESTTLAESLFKAGQNAKLNMRRVAQAPFWVLRGAGMPSVLIETGFITEKAEARMLAQASYQQKLADAFAAGILDFIKR